MPRTSAGALPLRGSLRRRLGLDRSSLGAAGLGGVSVAGFAPLYLYPLPIVTMALFIALLSRAESPRRAAALGGWFGLGFFLIGVSWVYVSLNTFGAMPAPLAALATLLFCMFLALFPAAASFGFAVLRAPAWAKITLYFPAAWVLGEWWRGWIFTGFPWLALGYSQVPASPLRGFAPLTGAFGISLLVVLSAALVVLLHGTARPRSTAGGEGASRSSAGAMRRLATHPALYILAALWVGGYALTHVKWTEPAGAPVSVSLLQGNIPQDIKWTPEGLRTTFATYHRLALASDARLIVFPETALPLFLADVPPQYLESLAAHGRSVGGDVLIGVPEKLPSGEYYNSLISVGTSPTQVYRKTHLVPFGEYIPGRPVLGWIVGILSIPLLDFSRGVPDPKPLQVGGQRVAPNICYEDVFGEEIIRQLPEATILVNVSNVAWFGRSIAPVQHLQISQTRALETGRYMIRATNTGMTAIVNERGIVAAQAPQFETTALSGLVQGHTGTTPYIRWGNHPILALCAVLIAAALLLAFRARR
jgi:apolipoprotein N-acyltransferase